MQKHFSLLVFFKNCHFSCSKQTHRIVPATRLPPTDPACKSPLPAPSHHRRASRLLGKGAFWPRGRGEDWGCAGFAGLAAAWRADVEQGRSPSQLFHLQPLPVSFHLPLDAGPGKKGINKKALSSSKNGLAPSCIELKAARLKSWQRRGEGGPVPRVWGASLLSQSVPQAAVGTARGQGLWRWPHCCCPVRKAPECTWSEGHGGNTRARNGDPIAIGTGMPAHAGRGPSTPVS